MCRGINYTSTQHALYLYIVSDDLAHLRFCRNLSVLDLSYNRLEDPLIVDVLADMVILKGIFNEQRIFFGSAFIPEELAKVSL